MTTATADTKPTPDQIAADICDLLRKFHQESCYPTAMDCEINEAVNDILFVVARANWQIVISAEDARL